MHDPVVAPGGQFLALTSGLGFLDACFVDKRIIFLRLDSNLKRVGLIELSDFTGFEMDFEATGMLTSVYPVGDPIWRSNSTLEVELNWTCTTDSPNGIYRLELESLKASRTETIK